MLDVDQVTLTEVGPREGFQFEGIGNPGKIPTADKVRLVSELTECGLKRIQVTSFVSPRHVPQMADADSLSAQLPEAEGVDYTAIYLNDKGVERALAAGRYRVEGRLSFTASETFSLENQRRNHEQDVAMQRSIIAIYQAHGIPVTAGGIMAAFGCNYEGDIPTSRVIELIGEMRGLAAESGSSLTEIELADTMGWADPELIKRTVGAVRERWPDLTIALHLHDTRGTGLANVYAALEMGVSHFDTSVGGLGGCPFAKTVAGNVATEDVVFMCERMGVRTGVDLERLIECARLAEKLVGHPLPSRMAHVATPARQPARAAAR